MRLRIIIRNIFSGFTAILLGFFLQLISPLFLDKPVIGEFFLLL